MNRMGKICRAPRLVLLLALAVACAAPAGAQEPGDPSESQKRDIFYNDAACFLRLGPAQIARHHGR